MLNLAISLNLLTFSCVLLLVTIPGNEAFSESSSGSAFSISSSANQQQPQWTPNGYRPELGVYIGPMLSAISISQQHRPTADDRQIMGHVFAVNESAIQLVNFTFGVDVPDTFFWLDRTEVPTREGIRLRTFEYGLSPIGQYRSGQQILLILPEFEGEQLRINEFRSLSLFSLNEDIILGITRIPDNLIVPRTQLLPDELHGTRYDVQSGPIQILDTRTIKIFGFIFQGDKAPDGYFFVGRGLNVSKEAGVKAAIRGRDTFELISPMNERYTGGKDIYVELPEGHDVQHIDWLSVYCLRFEVDYGHIFIRNISPMIPPFVPPPNRFEEELEMSENKIWHASNLLGTESQLNFTFQLGPPGGKNGYKSIMGVSRPPKFVWYVNGYLAELYLKRGITYTFIVEGGQNISVPELNNPLYLTDNAYGGYSKLSVDEQRNTRKFTQEAHGRLCRWVEMSDINAETFNAFVDFRDTLRLECDESDQPAFLTFTPGPETPNTLYYASSNNYQMGGRIHVVDQFPADLKDIVVEPYRYDAKRHQEKMELTRENGAQRFSTGIIPIILLNILALSFPFLIIFVLY